LIVLDTKEYVSALRELTEAGQEVSVRIFGSSMVPFLGDGRDEVLIKKPDRELKVGDVVFFQRDSGRYILHRIWKIKPEGYYIVGDSQEEIEGPVRQEQIFAYVTRARRKGKWVGPGNFWWEFFEHVWIYMVPVRRVFIRSYTRVCGKDRKGK
jgi:hypothetical protein